MPACATHVYRRAIRFSDTDAAGVAHFSRLLVMVEEAVHDFFKSRQVAVLDTASGWPFVSIHADYTGGCRFHEEITVTLGVEKIGNSSLEISFEATKADGSVCFRGVSTLCHIDPTRNVATPIPLKTRNALGGASV